MGRGVTTQHLGRPDVAARATGVAAAVAGGIVLVLLAFPLLLGEPYCGFDLTLADLGVVCALQRALEEGASLGIAPHLSGGSPLLARPTAQLLYPLRWLVLPFPADFAVSLQALMHLALGAAATAWLARTFRARALAAACAGLLFACSGTALNLMFHSVYLVAVAWLPLAWAAARRALHPRGERSDLLLLVVALSGLALGGEPQAFGIAAALTLYEAIRVARYGHGRGRGAGRIVRVLAAIPIGAALAVLPWIAFWSEATLSPRTGAQALPMALRWSFDPSLWPAVILPSFVTGGFLNENLWSLVAGEGMFLTKWNPFPYLGPIIFVSVICGATLRRARPASLVALVGLVFSLGAYTPVLPLVMKLLPPLALFRYPQKYLLVTTLAAVVVSVDFLGRLGRARALSRRLLLAGGVLAAALVGAYLFLLIRGPEIAGIQSWLSGPSAAHVAPLDQLARRAVLTALVTLIAAMIACVALPRRRQLCLLIAVLDVVSTGVTGLPRGAPLADLSGPLDRFAAATTTAAATPVVVCTHNLVEEMGMRGPGDSPVWNTMALYRLYLLNELQACAGVISPITYSPLATRLNRDLVDRYNRYLVAPARALGCTHLVMDGLPRDEAVDPVEFSDLPEATRAFMRAGPRVLALRDPLPPVFTARRPTLIAEEDAVLERLLTSHSAAQVLAVVDDPEARLAPDATLPAGEGAGQPTVVWRDTDVAVVQAAGNGGAVVALRAPFLVGWHAEQSGRALPVVRVGGQHVAAVVEQVSAGPIRFRYRTPFLGVGIAITIAGSAAFGLLIWFAGRRRP